ncbi:uncharacterized protein LOC134187633 [Corticium candelabrum]|uniref:uncharacterized protein LOC134187633 n=1 Tax=Corticium candelabrum TaxID=121492 RepID=UPI002E265E12|nr:uncharacterized protein LOC134187633 [Corticium candelabrum]
MAGCALNPQLGTALNAHQMCFKCNHIASTASRGLEYCKSKSALEEKATQKNVTKQPANDQQAFESQWLKLVAKSLNGKEVQLKAKASDTIATLKKQLGSKDDSSSMDQLLVVKGKQLRDEQTLSDAGLTNGMTISFVLCPRTVTSMGSDVGELFVRALEQGSIEITRVKIVIVGKDRTGKSSFKRSLLNQKFQVCEASTPVAKAEVAVCEACNWRALHDKDQQFLDRQIARAAIHAQHASNVNEAGSKGADNEDGQTANGQFGTNTSKPRKATALSQDTAIKTNTDKLDKAAASIGDAESSTSNAKLDEAIVLTEGIGRAIKQFQSDRDILKQEESKVYYTIWDLGGQELLLPGQQQAITPRSIVFVVFDARKFLNDEAESSHRSSPDSEETPIPNMWIEKNYDALSLWASATFLARAKGHHLIDSLDKLLTCASPIMFLIGTHIAEVSEEMIQKQNKFLSEKFFGQKFTEHIYRPSQQPDDWFFRVENSVSNPESPIKDPGVVAVKQVIGKVTNSVSFKSLIPATWAVLEKICDGLEEKMGSALSNVKDILALANRLCRISEEKEVRAALVYLDDAGSVIFPQKSEKLKDTVVTKPNWLFTVFSVIASVHYPSGLFCMYWTQAKTTGIVNWELMKDCLRKAGVKEEEYEVVLNLLNCFYLLSPKSPPSQLAISYETEYFVPCLLESDPNSPLAAAAPVNPNDLKPFSLIISPFQIAFIPEQLHFRLMTCCIEEYPDEPMLTRHHSVYRVEKDVMLEMAYHSKKYIILTIDTTRPCYEIASLCTGIRLFITKKLEEVKKPGLPNFHFSVNIQPSGPAVPVDPTKLVCIDEYKPSGTTPLRVNISRRDVKLDPNEKAALDCWFHEDEYDVPRGTIQQMLKYRSASICTSDEITEVASKLSARWEELVSRLSSSLFTINKIEEIKGENRDKFFLQARKALDMWTNQLGGKASRQLLIKTICDIGCRLQAEEVFGYQLVEYVSLLKNRDCCIS